MPLRIEYSRAFRQQLRRFNDDVSCPLCI